MEQCIGASNDLGFVRGNGQMDGTEIGDDSSVFINCGGSASLKRRL
jgi:hypothetical protein